MFIIHIHYSNTRSRQVGLKTLQAIVDLVAMVEKRKSPDQIVVARVHHAAGSSDHLMFAQEPESPVKQANQTANPQLCHVDLTRPGTMKDIISNALLRGLDHPESEVKTFLHGAETRFSTGTELLQSAARHFKISDSVMNAAVKNSNTAPARTFHSSTEPVIELQFKMTLRSSSSNSVRMSPFTSCYTKLAMP